MLPDPDSKAEDQPGARATIKWRSNNDDDDDQGRIFICQYKRNQIQIDLLDREIEF